MKSWIAVFIYEISVTSYIKISVFTECLWERNIFHCLDRNSEAFSDFLWIQLPSSHVAHDLVLWMRWEKWVSLTVPCTDGEGRCLLTHSSLCRGNHGLGKLSVGPKPSPIGEGVMDIKSNYSSYPLQCIQTLCIYFSLELCVGKFTLEIWSSTKPLSSVSACLSQCFTRAPGPGQERLELVYEPLQDS